MYWKGTFSLNQVPEVHYVALDALICIYYFSQLGHFTLQLLLLLHVRGLRGAGELLLFHFDWFELRIGKLQLQKLKLSLLTGLLVTLDLVGKAYLERNSICKKYQGQTFAKKVAQNAIYWTWKTNHKISFVGETGQRRQLAAVSAH